jgi:hypothetical protein
MKRLVAACVVLLALAACFGPDPNLTATGKGRPDITADFPPIVDAGETFDVTLEITNPGPVDMDGITIAFARLGDPSLPIPVVDAGATGTNEAIVTIDPEPQAVSLDGIIYTFPPLGEGDSTTITFELKAPDISGAAGNSIQVYDSRDPERARGIRFLTTVRK